MNISKSSALDNQALLNAQLLRSLNQNGTRSITPSSGLDSLASSDDLGNLLGSYASQGRTINGDRQLLRTAEVSLSAIESLTGDLQELAEKSEDDSLTQDERDALQDDFTALRDEIDRIASQTEYAGDPLLDGSAGELTLSSGAGTTSELRIALGDFGSAALGLGGLDISTQGSAADVSASLKAALGTIGETRKSIASTDDKLVGQSQSIVQAETGLLAGYDLSQQVSKLIDSSTIVADQIARQGSAAVALQGRLLGSLVQDLLG